MKIDQAQRIMDGVLVDIARLYDMPELIGAKIIKSDKGAQKLERFNVNVYVTPRGQLASFVETLNVGVTLYGEADATGHLVELKPAYRHPGGGSNGYSVRLIAVTATGCDGEPEYVGLISDKLCHVIARRHGDAVRDNCKGKSGYEIKKMYEAQ